MGVCNLTGGSSSGGVVSLDAGASVTPDLGAKAANLARARAAGMAVVDGFVVAPDLATAIAGGYAAGDGDAVRGAWEELTDRGRHRVVVRSSSLAEDTASSSQAGVFDSVVDVHGWDAFTDAVATVVSSASTAAAGSEPAPLAVLVQRHVDPAWAGVMFGVDPVTGRRDRLVVAAVAGGPQALVGGEVAGHHLVLDRLGRLTEDAAGDQPLSLRSRRALARQATTVESLFGGPQDVEWALTVEGRLLLLQSRPVTAMGAIAEGPVLGPGPVAETFPDPLSPLEQDLWLDPLREAIGLALGLIGRATRRRLESSPIAVAVGGRAAVDLDLFEAGTVRRRGLAVLDPRPPLRRLRFAWRIGRLRVAVPGLANGLVERLDHLLAEVPNLIALEDEELVDLLARSTSALRAAHGHELLAGVLTAPDDSTAANVALSALSRGRRLGRTDAEIVAVDPVVLTLVPPSIASPSLLPASTPRGAGGPRAGSVADLGPREALRLRIRWLHELGARTAAELGRRLAATGLLDAPTDVAALRLATLDQVVRSHRRGPLDVPASGPPLPDHFRLASDGTVVPVASADPQRTGTGAGGGRAIGRVDQSREPMPGAVLVVTTLDPRLAPLLPGLAALVAETGSPLSHLAILAREHGVPTAVGVTGATQRFLPGTEVLVDGTTGEVRTLRDPDDELAEAPS